MKSHTSHEFLATPVVVVVHGLPLGLMIAADLGVWAWIVATIAVILLGTLASRPSRAADVIHLSSPRGHPNARSRDQLLRRPHYAHGSDEPRP